MTQTFKIAAAAGLACAFAGVLVAQNAPAPQSALGLAEVAQMGLAQNPRLAQAVFRVDAARGRALQAGLYPNPTISATFDELGDRTGPSGVNTLPLVSQEIVTGKKLRLDRAAANREVDQATLAVMNQRYALLSSIRQAFFEVVTLQSASRFCASWLACQDNRLRRPRKCSMPSSWPGWI